MKLVNRYSDAYLATQLTAPGKRSKPCARFVAAAVVTLGGLFTASNFGGAPMGFAGLFLGALIALFFYVIVGTGLSSEPDSRLPSIQL